MTQPQPGLLNSKENGEKKRYEIKSTFDINTKRRVEIAVQKVENEMRSMKKAGKFTCVRSVATRNFSLNF